MIKKTLLFARELWTLLRPYWQSDERAIAWLVLAANILLTLGLVYMNMLFNSCYNLFYDALQNKAMAAFYQQLWRFCMLARSRPSFYAPDSKIYLRVSSVSFTTLLNASTSAETLIKRVTPASLSASA
jgi:ABC-type uncharacterized transport system fused permease/ATPase subunit